MSESCDHQCESCHANCSDRSTQPQKIAFGPGSSARKVIGVISGKGGVGKSLVTSLLAVGMRSKGYKTAIFDADITGPSIPKIFGLKEKACSGEFGILPVETAGGIRVLSINSLLENETDPVLWRGPIIAGTLCQLWSGTQWGDLDFLFVDMPPGTGDVPLTVFQSLPVDGVIVVTSPQELVAMIVEKAFNMAAMMKIPLLGVVENMSWFECSECGTKYPLFGASQVERVAAEHQIDATAQIPLTPELTKLCDHGRIEDSQGEWLAPILEKLEKC